MTTPNSPCFSKGGLGNTTKTFDSGGFVREYHALCISDQLIVLGLTMQGEIEDIFFDLLAPVEITIRHHQFILEGAAHGHYLAGWRNDAALSD